MHRSNCFVCRTPKERVLPPADREGWPLVLDPAPMWEVSAALSSDPVTEWGTCCLSQVFRAV